MDLLAGEEEVPPAPDAVPLPAFPQAPANVAEPPPQENVVEPPLVAAEEPAT